MAFVYKFTDNMRGDAISIAESCEERVAMHSHSFFEFVYVVSGSANHIINDTPMVISQGDYFLIDLKSAHEYHKIEGGGDLKVINCFFLPRFIDRALDGATSFGDILNNYLIKFGYRKSLGEVAYKSYRDTDGTVGALMRKMLSEYEEKKPGYEEVLKNFLVCLLIYLVRNGEYAKDNGIVHPTRFIKEYVAENYMKAIKLSDASRELNFSLTHTSLSFKRDTGMTFRDYLTAVRMEKARELISSTDKTVSEVAFLVGYEDDTFFYKAFRKHFAHH